MKDTYYFQHDYDPLGDPKLSSLVGKFGAIGYGIYWRIVEMLHSDNEHKLKLKEYVFLSIAQQMSTDVEQIKAIVNYCLTTCELFVSDETFFWSERVLRNIENRIEIAKKKSFAGKKSAEIRALKKSNSTDVEHVLTDVQHNSTKERKEKKIKDIYIPTLEEFKSFILENDKTVSAKSIEIKYKSWVVNDWKDGNNVKIVNWKQKALNIIPYLEKTKQETKQGLFR